MKRRWLFFWVALAVASFGLIMQAAHIGSTNLWILVSGVAFALGAIVAGTLNAAGRRLRPWPSRRRASGKGGAVMKMFRWVVVAVMLLLLILCATDVAPNVMAYSVIPGLAVVAMIAGSLDRTERR